MTGAAGFHNGVVIQVAPRIVWGDNVQNTEGTSLGAAVAGTTSVARTVFCGGQAAIFATGREAGWPYELTWVEWERDYLNQVGISAGMIAGLKKTVLNSRDYAVIQVPTFASIPA